MVSLRLWLAPYKRRHYCCAIAVIITDIDRAIFIRRPRQVVQRIVGIRGGARRIDDRRQAIQVVVSIAGDDPVVIRPQRAITNLVAGGLWVQAKMNYAPRLKRPISLSAK